MVGASGATGQSARGTGRHLLVLELLDVLEVHPVADPLHQVFAHPAANSKMFDKIVRLINESLRAGIDVAQKAGARAQARANVSVLDVFGFETFEKVRRGPEWRSRSKHHPAQNLDKIPAGSKYAGGQKIGQTTEDVF